MGDIFLTLALGWGEWSTSCLSPLYTLDRRLGGPQKQSGQLGEEKIFSTSSRPALGSTQPPIQWVPGALFPGVKRPGREADHSRRCGSINPLPHMPSGCSAYLVKHRDKFTLCIHPFIKRNIFISSFICSLNTKHVEMHTFIACSISVLQTEINSFWRQNCWNK
jgi:hypothetical protein